MPATWVKIAALMKFKLSLADLSHDVLDMTKAQDSSLIPAYL